MKGLVRSAELVGRTFYVHAVKINALRLRRSDSVRTQKACRSRITGSDYHLAVTRADRLVLTGDRNSVTVTRGRTTVRARGEDNVLDLRRRTRCSLAMTLGMPRSEPRRAPSRDRRTRCAPHGRSGCDRATGCCATA